MNYREAEGKFCRVRLAAPQSRLFAQIALANQSESFFDEQLSGKGRIIDIECQRRAAGADKQGVGVVNIDLRRQKRCADHHQWMLRPLGHEHYEKILLGE